MSVEIKYLENEQEIEINNQTVSPVIIERPKNDEQIYEEMFPYPITVRLNNADNFSKVDYYLRNLSNNGTDFLGYKNVVGNEEVLTWTDAPAVGSYAIYAVATDKNNQTIK